MPPPPPHTPCTPRPAKAAAKREKRLDKDVEGEEIDVELPPEGEEIAPDVLLAMVAQLHEQFEATLGDGSRFGVRLHYSHEGERFGQALETGGGIATALDLLCADGDDAFWAVSADIFMPEFVFDMAQAKTFAESALLAHLWFVPKQPRHPSGDFGIDAQGFATLDGDKQVYSNIGLYKRAFFDGVKPGVHERIRVALDRAIAARAVSAEIYEGPWVNVGAVDQLEELNAVR